ncbi:MAG: hypothetical protein F6K10_10310 [Moorea sp. SIO2B7]|nr:hypothetical protein [Moorena sp. SIO2B7]
MLDTLNGYQGAIYSVDFSPDGNIIATASSDNTVKLWKRNSNEKAYKDYKTLSGHKGVVYTVAFSPDGSIMATGSSDNTVKLFLDSEQLLVYGCNWVRDYLKHNDSVEESDRSVCDAIEN